MKPRPVGQQLPQEQTVTTAYECDSCGEIIRMLSIDGDDPIDTCLECGSFLIHIVA